MKSNTNRKTPVPVELEARHVAGELLSELLHKHTPLDVCMARSHAYSQLSDQNKAFGLRLMQHYLRHYGLIEQAIGTLLHKPLPKVLTYIHVQIGLAMVQIARMEIPPYAAVNSAVELTKRASPPHAGVVNAVLNKWLKEQHATLPENILAVIPAWLKARWMDIYGEAHVRGIAQAMLKEPPLDISFKSSILRDDWLAAHADIPAAVIADSLRLYSYPGRVSDLDGYQEGHWWVQDVAASLPVLLMGKIRGKTVLDMCAAPGGKTMQLAACGANVIAVESNKKRADILKENLARTHYAPVNVQIADALKYRPETPPQAILLDAPCSATGTLRRNPDVLLHRNLSNILEQTEKQRELLVRAVDMLPQGGILVYAVCSLEPEEGEKQIEHLLNSRSDIIVGLDEITLKLPLLRVGFGLRTLPDMLEEQGGMDGFFMTRLVKK